MKQTHMRPGARRLTALGASTALAASALAVGIASPAAAAPVTVSTTVTDTAGNAIDGQVTVFEFDDFDDSWDVVDGSQFSNGLAAVGLEPGAYKFKFSANGYATEYYTDKADLASADVVQVAGATVLPPVQLAPAATISGVVTDDAGRPVPYTGVELIDVATQDYYDRGYQTTTTGKDGVFTFAAAPSNYKLYVSGTTIGRKSYRGEYYNDKYDFSAADVISHGAAPTGVGAIALATGGLVRGTVTGPGGVPLARALVTVTEAGDCSDCEVESDYTDAAGNYAVVGVTPGSHVVTISDPAQEYVTEYYPDAATFDAATPITVAKDQVVDLNAELAPRPAIDPTTVDLSGRVTDSSGAPVVAAQVTAYSTPANRKNVTAITTARTNRQGYYAFTSLDAQNAVLVDDAFKLEVYDPIDPEVGAFSRLGRWYGGAETYDKAAPAAIGAAGADVVLPLTGGIAGVITSEAGEPVLRTRAYFESEDGTSAGSAAPEYDGSYANWDVPAGKYRVRFADNGYQVLPESFIAHVPEWFADAVTPEDAKLVEVKSGQVTQGVNAALAATLKAVEAPEIKGKPYVGKTLTATPGEWTLRNQVSYGYEWLVGDQVVGTGEKITVSKGWTGKRLTLRVTATAGSFSGTALANTQAIGVQPKAKIKATGNVATITVKAKGVKAKKVKGTVLVREIVKVKPNGKVKYKKIGKAKITKGKARVSLAKVKDKGKHKLVFGLKFKGKKIGAAEITKTVKRKR